MANKPPAKKKERFVPKPAPPKERFVPAPPPKNKPKPPPKAAPPPKPKTPPYGGGSSSGGSGKGGNSSSNEASRYHSQIPGAPTHDTSYTPSGDYAKQVVQQLKDLQSSMSQEDFAHLMQTNGLGSSPAGADGVVGEQQSTGTGQMGWKIPFTVDPQGHGGSQAIPPIPQDVIDIANQRITGAPFRGINYGNPIIRPQSTTDGSQGEANVATRGTVSQAPGGTLYYPNGNGPQQQQQSQQTPSADQQNALAVLEGLLAGAGLGGLVGQVQDLLSQGYTDPTAIEYLLEQTPEYQRRFSGNAQREANGMAPLSPSEYLATEQSYQDVLRAAGMPAGFYDSPDDFASWISADVSPSEVQNRVNDALHFAQMTDPSSRTALAAYYGIDDAHIAAYFLDNQRALPLLNKQAAAADIGGAALDQGLSLTDMNRALRFADLGVTQGQAQQAYSQIAGFLQPEQAIAQRFGQSYDQGTAEDETLGQNAAAALKRSKLNDSETSLFSGTSGVGRYALTTPDLGVF